jgi:hypothetical protein
MPDPIFCAAGCKRSVADESEAVAKGWECLEITNRYRCPQCWRELREVNERYREQPS